MHDNSYHLQATYNLHTTREQDIRHLVNIKMTPTTSSPPITVLRPLHCLQHETSQEETSSVETKSPHWQSGLSPRPDEETCIKAFVKLVSHVVVLEQGEAYCIQQQNSSRGRYFILAHLGQNDFNFVNYHDDGDELPTDFSIGDSNPTDFQKVSFR